MRAGPAPGYALQTAAQKTAGGDGGGIRTWVSPSLPFSLVFPDARRERAGPDATYEDAYVAEVGPDGKTVERRVDRAFLDLTDVQNREFRYVL